MEDDLQAGDDGLYCVGFLNKHWLLRERVQAEFSRFGRIVSIRGATDGTRMGWCFVRYANPEEAVRAITGMRESPHLCDPNNVKYVNDRGDGAASQSVNRPQQPRRDESGVSPLVRGDTRPAPPSRHSDKHEVYVGNWPLELDESSVMELFQKFDISVSDVRLYRKDTTSFAFVVVPGAKDVELAIKSMNGGKVAGHQIKVSDAYSNHAGATKKDSGPPPSRPNTQNAGSEEKSVQQRTPRQSPRESPQQSPRPSPQQQRAANVRQRLGLNTGRGGGRGGARPLFEGRPAGPPSGAHGGPPSAVHGGPPGGVHGGPPGGVHGGPSSGMHGGPPGGAHGGPSSGMHGGPPGGASAGPPPDRMPPLVLPGPPPLVLPGPPPLVLPGPPPARGPQNGAPHAVQRPRPGERRDEYDSHAYEGFDGPPPPREYDYRPREFEPRPREFDLKPPSYERPEYWEEYRGGRDSGYGPLKFEAPGAGGQLGRGPGQEPPRGLLGAGPSRGAMRRSFDMRGEPENAYDEPPPFAKRARYGPGPGQGPPGEFEPRPGAPPDLPRLTRTVGPGPALPPPPEMGPGGRSSMAISERIKSRLHAPMEVVVANFPVGTNEHDLMAMFSKYEPLNVRIMVNNSSQHPDDFTYAYVTVASRMAADEAVMEMDGLAFHGRPLVVETKKK